MTTTFFTLINAEEALPLLDQAQVRFLDCQYELMDPEAGERCFRAEHIPGALFVDVNKDLSSTPTSSTGRHPLPDPQSLIKKLGAWGISSEVQVIAYDSAGGGMGAARLWWLLRWLGHNKVAVLNGGLNYWKKLGYPTDTKITSAKERQFVARIYDSCRVNSDEILQKQQQGFTLLDARGAERYRGEVEPIDPIGGHIPKALNLFVGNNFDTNGLWKNKVDLLQQINAVLGDTMPEKVIHYCGSGVSACGNILAMEHVGLSGSLLYPGSWSEWIRDPERPIATGNE